jgi:hypothetical protein
LRLQKIAKYIRRYRMSPTPTRNLDSIVDIVIETSPLAAPRRSFDMALIQGSTPLIPETERLRKYASTQEMLDDGWTDEDPEYQAAQLYFSQSAQTSPPDYVWIGRRNGSASRISNCSIAGGGGSGIGYSVNDLLTIVQEGASGGTIRVTEVGDIGEIISAVLVSPGAGYTVATNLPTTVTPSGGSGCLINITGIETYISTYAVSGGGTGYVVGDMLTAVQAGASGGTFSVTEIGNNGNVTAVDLVNTGLGYNPAAALPTTMQGVPGTGGTVDITGTAIVTFEIDNPGIGYAVGDDIEIVQADGSGAILHVVSTGPTGEITDLSMTSPGNGYLVADNVPTNPVIPGGSGCTVNILTTTITSYDVGNGGQGYGMGDIITPVYAGASGAAFSVTGIDPSIGAITAISLQTDGSGYPVSSIPTTVTHVPGSGATIDILTVTSYITDAEIAIGSAGSGYSVGDILTPVQAGGSGASFIVKSVDSTGEVLNIQQLTGGSGYSAEGGVPTTVSPAGGSGCYLNIIAVGAESVLDAFQINRAMDNEWYVGMDVDAVTEDHKEVAAWVQAAVPDSLYAFTTKDTNTYTISTSDIFSYLKNKSYSRCMGQYSTTDYAIAAIVGYAMGANTQLANSAYTLKFKIETGVDTEILTTTQILNIEKKNGNLYLNYDNYYKIYEQGVMANGVFFDEIINLDMLKNKIQLNVMDLLYSVPKVPQTEAGVTQIIDVIASACKDMVRIAFMAPGVWTGRNILNLKTGDYLPDGYAIQSEKVADQSRADREARKSPNIYVAIKLAGAIHSVVIGVYVAR